jgi:SAM-dependent methyltransferase
MSEAPALTLPRRAVRAARRRHTALRRFWHLSVRKPRYGIEHVRNYVIDRRYGGSCGGAIPTRFGELGAYGTSSVDYWQLRRIFAPANGLEIQPGDVLVDVGCGKGRVLNHWLEDGHAGRIVGIEIDEEFAGFAQRRLSAHPQVEVLCADALEVLPLDANLMFLFNPFGPELMARLADRVAELYAPEDPLTIVYYLPKHEEVWLDDPRFEVEPLPERAFYRGIKIRLRPRDPASA